MVDWKSVTKLSDQNEKTREAAFEAEMLAMIAPTKSTPVPSVTNSSTPSSPIPDGIQISVTTNGQTALYDLKTVPRPVQQQIMNAWRPSTTANIPPLQSAPSIRHDPALPTSRPKTMRFAMALNLFLPGAGQFYLGQRMAGSAYAIAFLACLATMLALFARAYSTYLQLSTNGDIMDAGNLEQLAKVFNAGALGWISFIGTAIYVASTIHLVVSRRSK
jgi:TM2 domain-containing membrane protein YozV